MEQCGGTVQQSWWKSVVEKSNSHDGTVEQSWWNTVVEQWNSHGVTVCWNSGTLMVGQCNEIVEQ